MTYSAMILYMAITMITPGPNNLTMLFLGAKYGLKGTRKFLTASAASLFIKILLCGLLNVFLADLMPILVDYLKWAGAAYMMYLGFVMARSGWTDTDAQSSDSKTLHAQQTESTYKSGIILQLLNMKSWISSISLFAVYVIPQTTAVADILWVSVLYLIFMILSSLIWGEFGSLIRGFISKYRKPFGIVMGLSLCYCAVTAVL